jgi:hypothetical protein
LLRLISASALGLAALGLGTTLHLPALAASEYQQFVAPMTASTCTSASPCLQWTNKGGGAGVQGVSIKGNGGVGQTSWKSTSAKNAKAGIVGQDLSTSGSFSSGVLGTSPNGIGVQGTSTNGNGVVALSSLGSALFAENTGSADGAQVVSLNNDGTNTSTQNNSTSQGVGRSGLWGHDDSTDGGHLNVGVAGSSTNGIGVSGSSAGYVGVNAVGGGSIDGGFNDVPALSVVSGGGNLAFDMLVCSNPLDNPCTYAAGSKILTLDTSGNLSIAGQIRTSGSCSSGCIVGRNGVTHRVVSYAPTQAMPSIDDFGEAQLVNGHAYVRLSADYANVVDRQSNYLVFITPEGDSRGLYVTDKTSAGFTVRENEGGRSTLAFSYRIVAKPYGVSKPRLPMESVGPRRPASTVLHTRG